MQLDFSMCHGLLLIFQYGGIILRQSFQILLEITFDSYNNSLHLPKAVITLI